MTLTGRDACVSLLPLLRCMLLALQLIKLYMCASINAFIYSGEPGGACAGGLSAGGRAGSGGVCGWVGSHACGCVLGWGAISGGGRSASACARFCSCARPSALRAPACTCSCARPS